MSSRFYKPAAPLGLKDLHNQGIAASYLPPIGSRVHNGKLDKKDVNSLNLILMGISIALVIHSLDRFRKNPFGKGEQNVYAARVLERLA